MMLKAYLLDASEHQSDPSEILKFLNYRLAVISHTDNFATMCIAEIDRDRKTLRYASAGHETGLLVRTGGQVTELPSTGLVLGIIEDADWTTETLPIGAGDRLFLATDGVTEAMNGEGEQFGRKRLARTFEAFKNVAVQGCVDRIGHMVAEHFGGGAQADDITLLALEVVKEGPDERENGQKD
jgi:sigma-B regulation protein RsbU (phosphoserine phosphatase)